MEKKRFGGIIAFLEISSFACLFFEGENRRNFSGFLQRHKKRLTPLAPPRVEWISTRTYST